MKYAELREPVYEANRILGESGLVTLTWGNVSGVNRNRSLLAIKPSGVSYSELQSKDIVILDLETGEKVDGTLRPSSDTRTHLEIYRSFRDVYGVVHTHSPYATAWAQMSKGIPVYGTTHADTFYGTVPITRFLTEQEVKEDYERGTGQVIVEHFSQNRIEPLEMPAVLLPCHGPFTWGVNPAMAVENAVVLEEVAKIATYMGALWNSPATLPDFILEKHYQRKHGPDAYYGQSEEE